MKNRKRWLAIGIALLLVLFVVVALVRPKPGRSVQVAEAETRDLVAVVKAPGIVKPQTQVNISAEVPGRITRLVVREGDSVRSGDLLLQLDDATFRAQVQQSKAQLNAAQARLRSAETTLRSAEPTYERRKKLFEERLLSPGEMEDAEREYQTAVSNYESALEEVSQWKAALTSSQDQLSKTVYRSPIDGTIIELNVEQGEIVVIGTMNNPGTRILAVADLSRMTVSAEVDETDVVDVRLDQRSLIEVDALPDTSFVGRVTEIGHSARRTGSAAAGETDFEVEVLFEEPIEAIRPGMTADVEIETNAQEGVLSVPIQAVVVRSREDLEDEEDSANEPASAESADSPREVSGVFVLDGDVARFRRVETGIASDTDIQIMGDVESGEEIIIGPYNVLRELKPGARVKPERDEPRRGRSR